MRKPIPRSCLLSVVFLTIISFPGLAQSVALKFNPVAGQPYECSIETDIEQKIGGQPVNMNVKGGFVMTLKRTEGTTRIMEGSYTRFVLDLSTPGYEIHANTDNPPLAADAKADPTKIMGFMFSKIVGQKFNFIINDTGEVLKVTGFDKMVDSIANIVSGELGMPDSFKQGLKDGMSGQFNDESMKTELQEFYLFYPSKPVKMNDTWSRHDLITTAAFERDIETTYTVKAIEGNELKLSTVSKVNNVTNHTKQGDLSFKGEQTSDILMDLRSGMIISKNFVQNLKDEAHDHTMVTKGKFTRKIN